MNVKNLKKIVISNQNKEFPEKLKLAKKKWWERMVNSFFSNDFSGGDCPPFGPPILRLRVHGREIRGDLELHEKVEIDKISASGM